MRLGRSILAPFYFTTKAYRTVTYYPWHVSRINRLSLENLRVLPCSLRHVGLVGVLHYLRAYHEITIVLVVPTLNCGGHILHAKVPAEIHQSTCRTKIRIAKSLELRRVTTVVFIHLSLPVVIGGPNITSSSMPYHDSQHSGQ
jgi:hypothetical protein